MELQVYNTEGKSTGKTIMLNKAIFGIEPNDHAIYLDVKQYLNNNRQGTHKTLEKSEISGSTRKLHRQKGTGGSRKGSIKNPLFKGGARVFGPRPRDYDSKLNKKVKALARKSALSYKAKENNIIILENFSFDAPKTKQITVLLNSLNIGDLKSLLVIKEPDKNIELSIRNIPNTKLMRVSDINTYDILNAGKLLFLEDSIKSTEEILN